MDFKKIISYLDSECGDEEKLAEFFEKEDIKEFLLQKWNEHTNSSANQNSISYTPAKDITLLITAGAPQEEDIKTLPVIYNPFSIIEDNLLRQKLRSKEVHLENGKENQPYRCFFDINDFGIAGTGTFEWEGLEDIGLKFNPLTSRIEGIPHKAGDHCIVLKYKREGWVEGNVVFERQFILIVNPDPRSLWNNTPTPTDIEYYKPDCDCKFVKVEKPKKFFGLGKENPKSMVAASQRGRSHAHEGTPRDDHFSLTHHEKEGWYIMTVADGAGSARYSRQGSLIACQTVSDICNTHLGKYSKEIDELIKIFEKDNSQANRKQLGDTLYSIIGSAAFNAYKNIEKEAQETHNLLKDYATTLLVTLSKKFAFGWFIAAFWVGDGGIGIYNNKTQYLKIMGEPDGGEFAGQTRFLTMPEVMQPTEIYKRLRFEIVEDFTALILMSDGITDPKFETDANLGKIEKWNELWQDINSAVDLKAGTPHSAEQLLKWLDFWSQGNHDDRTIAILY